MRKLGLAVVCAAAFALAAPASAFGQNVGFWLGGGGLIPVGDFADVNKFGFNGTAGILISPTGVPVSFGIEGFFGRANADEDVTGAVDMNIYGGLAGISYAIPTDGGVSPFIFGHAGIMSFSPEDSDSFTEFAAGGGAGISFSVSPNLSIWVDGRYVWTDPVQFIPISAGVLIIPGG